MSHRAPVRFPVNVPVARRETGRDRPAPWTPTQPLRLCGWIGDLGSSPDLFHAIIREASAESDSEPYPSRRLLRLGLAP